MRGTVHFHPHSPRCGEQFTNSGTRSRYGIKSSRELNIFRYTAEQLHNINFIKHLSYIILYLCIFSASSVSFADEPGSEQWDYNVAKSIATTLADTPYWSMSLPYFRDLSARSQDWNVRLLHAKVELQRGYTDRAQKAIDDAMAIHPNNPRLWLMAGDIAADSGNAKTAIDYYAKVLSVQPNNDHAQLHLARQYFVLRQWQNVIDIYDAYLATHDPTSEILVRLSAACENIGDIARAEKYLLENIDKHSNRALAYLPLERFYRRQNDEARANSIAKERAKYQKNDDDRNLRKLLPSSR